jgi:hypothetical protein
MAARTDDLYDVFISHSPADQAWVRGELLPKLERAGLKVAVDYRDFEVGLPRLVNMERLVERSRKIVLVLTPAWLASEGANFEALLAQSADLVERLHRTVPLLLAPCELPRRIALLTGADFTDPATRDEELARLLRGLGARARVFISYKRSITPDEPLALRLRGTLERAGHSVFIDQRLKIGVQWAGEIQRQIEACDFLVVLLSEASAQSEMVAKEVEHAYQHHQRTGKARLLPVRVGYTDALPYQISHYLDQLQYARWDGAGDDERLIRQLLDAISDFDPLPAPDTPTAAVPTPLPGGAPRPYADPRFVETLRDPSGGVRLRSEFYIERDGDERLRRELSKPYGTTTTIRAPRQTGKSSLLIRGIAQAQQQGSRVVALDLQPVDERYLQNLDAFLQYFANFIVTRLRLDPAEVERAWRGALGPSDKLTYLMEEYVLPQADANVVLAIDEADGLLKTDFHDSFFGLLRFWHNNRAMSDLWERLDILMVISTEPHLLIGDVTQSPFNVGLKIALEDFDAAQVRDLNARYRSPLDERTLPALTDFLSGHPYLTRKALFTLLNENMTWDALVAAATTPKSPFGDHLRRYLWLLRDQPQLRGALKQIIASGRCADETAYYRLLQAGLVKGADSQSCTCRCALYAQYLKDKL